MDAPASPLRDAIERIALVGLGAASLTAERVEELADALAERGLVGRDDVREVIDEVRGRWRNETGRLGELAGDGLQSVLAGLGVGSAARDVRLDEVELRVAQLEHRLRLVEAASGPPERAEATDRPD